MPATNRRAQLLRFKVLMGGFIAQFQSTPIDALEWGFSGWTMRDMNDLADALGWVPQSVKDSPDQLRKPFWCRGGVGLTIFSPDGSSWTGAAIVPELSGQLENCLLPAVASELAAYAPLLQVPAGPVRSRARAGGLS
jgi:hypothetical protein